MTKPKDDGVKRWRNMPLPDGLDKNDELVVIKADVVLAADHDRLVGNLTYELSSANATISELESELATASKVIEKLKDKLSFIMQMDIGDVNQFEKINAEIEAIERGDK